MRRTTAPGPSDRSSHCASSTTQISGCASAASESRVSTARPTRKRSGRATRAQAERRSQRVTLRRRQSLEIVEQWHAQLMEGRERKFHLRFDASGTDDPAPFATPRGVIQKGRLSHAGLPTQNERAALAPAHRAQQLIEPRTLAGAATKHRSRVPTDEYQSPCLPGARARRIGLATDLDVAHCDLPRSQGPISRRRANSSPEWENRDLLPNGGPWFSNDSPLCRSGIW